MVIDWSQPVFGVAVFLLGACIGSFLNVAIYRLPRGLSVNEPKRSFCPYCKKQIPMWRNIPLVTWLVQRGKCAECDAPIAARYFIVELLTALVWLGCWFVFPDPAQAVFFMLLSAILITISAVDIELMLIPRQLTITGTLLGLGMAALCPEFLGEVVWWKGLLKSFYGFAFGWVGLWLVVLLGKLAFGKRSFEFDEPTEWMLREPETDEEELCFVIGGEPIGWSDIFYRKSDRLLIEGVVYVHVDGERRDAEVIEIKDNIVHIDGDEFPIGSLKSLDGKARKAIVPREAMGMGDVDLLGMLGACFGPASLLFTIFAASVVSIIWAVFNRLGFGRLMPFGPSIIAGAVLWVFWGQDLWLWYLQTVGVY
ncbi:prepilin peptidase [Rubritalea spongiae]|uniref:Prepilin peptidase n=1 Tax=Rubritalea spongiae TaxID=430797 RepID=A0ABW5E0A8_9BACT